MTPYFKLTCSCPEENEWVKPIMKGYQMECCDCGLVHEIDFKVIKIMKRFKDGTKLVRNANEKYSVMFRARRL